MNLGHFLKIIRTAGNYKQKEFANLLGITQNYLSLIETNKKNLSIEKIKKFANELKISEDGMIFIFLDVPKELPEKDKNTFKRLQCNIMSRWIYLEGKS